MASIFSISRSAIVAAALACSLPGHAAAQAITPTVDYPGTLGVAPSLFEERGLNLPVPPAIDIAAVSLQEAQDLAAFNNQQWSGGCVGTPPWIAIGTSVILTDVANNNPAFFCRFGGPGGGDGGTATFILASISEYRIEDVVVASLIDNTLGTPGVVELRGLFPASGALTVQAATLDVARANLLLAARARENRRFVVGIAVLTGGGPVVITDRILDQRLTGRDLLVAVFDIMGPNQAIAGSRVNCPNPNSTIGCAGGITVDVPSNTNAAIAHVFQTYFITTNVERTLTGGTTFYDVALTPLPVGAMHAALANAGFLVTDRFLRRLTDGPAEAAIGRGALWSEAWNSQSRFDAAAHVGAVAVDSQGLVFGAVARPSERWTLGLAGEYGDSDLSIRDAWTPEIAEANHMKVGAHALYRRGAFSASIAAMIGAFDTDTSGASVLGTANASYDATIWGAALEAGYDFALTDTVTLTPQIGAATLSWARDGFAESGGPAPLTVATAEQDQTRAWAGLRARWTPELRDGRLGVEAYVRAVSFSGDTIAHATTFDPQLPGEPFVVAGPDFGDTATEFGAALDYRLGERTRIDAAYDGRVGDSFDEHAGRITLRVAF